MAKGKYKDWLTKEGLTKLEGWARDGLTDEQIAHNIGITAKTLYEWKNRFSEICETLKKGKEVVDLEVENALLKRALGYEYEETKVIFEPDGRKRAERVKKHVLPDVTAQIFWLKNRKPEVWREKQQIEHSGSITNKHIDMSGLTTEELRRLAQLDEGTEDDDSRTGKT